MNTAPLARSPVTLALRGPSLTALEAHHVDAKQDTLVNMELHRVINVGMAFTPIQAQTTAFGALDIHARHHLISMCICTPSHGMPSLRVSQRERPVVPLANQPFNQALRHLFFQQIYQVTVPALPLRTSHLTPRLRYQ